MSRVVSLHGQASACRLIIDLSSQLPSDTDVVFNDPRVTTDTPFDVVALVCWHRPKSLLDLVERTVAQVESIREGRPFCIITVTKVAPPTTSTSVEGDSDEKTLSDILKECMGALGAQTSFLGHYLVDAASGHHAPPQHSLPFVATMVASTPPGLQWLWGPTNATPPASLLSLVRRAFWVLDIDSDGVLSNDDLCDILRVMWDGLLPPDVTVAAAHDAISVPHHVFFERHQFEDYCVHLWHRREFLPLWRLMEHTGIRDVGTPYTESDIVPIDTSAVYDLSLSCVEFLGATYGAFPEGVGRELRRWGGWDVVPHGCPFSRTVNAPPGPEGFLAAWAHHATVDPRQVLMYCRWWGYHGDLTALLVAKQRRPDRHHGADTPNVVHVLVLGMQGGGKTCLVNHLAGIPVDLDTYQPTRQGRVVVTRVLDDPNAVTLVFHEVEDAHIGRLIRDTHRMAHIDVVLMLFDGHDPYSFAYIADRQTPLMMHHRLPTIHLMTKADLTPVEQEYTPSAEEFCGLIGLSWPPVMTSVEPGCLASGATPVGLKNNVAELASFIVGTARMPEVALPCVQHEDTMDDVQHVNTAAWWPFVVGAVLVSVGAVWWTRRRK